MPQGFLKVLPKHLLEDDEPGELSDIGGDYYWSKFKGKPFYCQSYATKYYEITEAQAEQLKQSECCFNHMIGLPRKAGMIHPLYDYEELMIQDEERQKERYTLKATGLGVTEFKLRRYAWKATQGMYKNKHGCIVTGPRLELAISIIDRIKGLFTDYKFQTRNTVVYISDVKIEAFPSHHLDSMRGLNPDFILNDEADFFPPHEQANARALSERYIAKSSAEIDFVSTPNLPGGLCEQLDKEQNSIYLKRYLPYTVGMGRVYDNTEIERAKKSPSFEREYNLKYGYGEGNIFNNSALEAIVQPYSLEAGVNGDKVTTYDPGFGSSMFAIMALELNKEDGLIYVKRAKQHDRPLASTMYEQIEYHAVKEGFKNIVGDNSRPEIIDELRQRRNLSSVEGVVFSKYLSEMTQTAATAVNISKKVRIHPDFSDLIYQLRAVQYNERGHPDKKKLSFDLGDCFMMGVWWLLRRGSGASAVIESEAQKKEKALARQKADLREMGIENAWMFSG